MLAEASDIQPQIWPSWMAAHADLNPHNAKVPFLMSQLICSVFFTGGDQGLLNLYFSNWSTDDISKHLPFIYNVVSQAFYSYLPAFTQ